MPVDNTSNLLTIGTVASQVGVSIDTLRKWEARHGWPKPLRSAGGTRLFNDRQLEMLRIAKLGMNQGMPIAQALSEAHTRLNALDEKQSHEQDATNLLLTATRKGNLAPLRSALAENRRRLDPARFVDEIAAPLMQATGRLWASRQIDVWQEHAISAELMSFLTPSPEERTSNRNNAPLILLATPPGEKHSLGLLMAQLVLLHFGACCLYLGRETPIDDLIKAATTTHADILGLSISCTFPQRRARAFVCALRGRMPAECELWVGGSGAVSVKDSVLCTETHDICRQIKRWLNTHQSTHETLR